MKMRSASARSYATGTGLTWQDLIGLASLAVFIFSIPALSLDQDQKLRWLCQPLAALATVTNLHQFRLVRPHQTVICLVAICVYFSLTAFSASQAYVAEYFTVYCKCTLIGLALSMVVRTRTQLLTILGALAVSAFYVAYASHSTIQDTQQDLARAVREGQDIARYRSAGMFANPNIMGMYALEAITASVTLYFSVRSVFLRFLLVSSAACAAYLALFSGSRKAIIGMMFVVCLLLWLMYKLRRFSTAVTLLVALLLTGGGMIWIVNNPYVTRFSTQEESYIERASLLHEAWDLAQEHPILGLGYRGFEQRSRGHLYSHSTPMELLCNGGLITLGVYAVLWWGLYRSLRRCLAVAGELKERVLLYGVACILFLEVLNSLTAVVVEELLYIVLVACICGYFRGKEITMQDEGPAPLRP